MKTTVHRNDEKSRTAIDIEVTFDPATLTTTDTPFGVMVRLEDCHPSGEIGGPAFPARVLRVALPHGTEATSVTARIVSKVRALSGPVFIAPLQAARPGVKKTPPTKRKRAEKFHDHTRPCPPDEELRKERIHIDRLKEPLLAEPLPPAAFIEPSQEVYLREQKKARPTARLSGAEMVGMTNVALVEINPVQLNRKGDLELASHIEVELNYRLEAQKTPAPDIGEEDETVESVATGPQISSREQARRLVDMARLMVVNPEAVVDFSDLIAPVITNVDYLVITDNQRWNADTITSSGPATGDLVAQFNRLTAWKTKRGLKTHVASISDIVAGRYGNFTTNARDLQEVIRNFLKFAHSQWGVSWCLLGGDIDIVPVRRIVGFADGWLSKTSTEPPEEHRGFWTGTFLKLHSPGHGSADPLLNADNGLSIPYDATGTSSSVQRGWYFVTDDSYSTRSTTATDYIRVNGPAAEVNATLQWVSDANTIPTDFYYASLNGPNYNVAGRHDWDLVDNGFYGTHNDNNDMDGVSYHADVSIGRAPVATEAQAAAFVDKVIAYESFRQPDGTVLGNQWPRKMLIGAANWGGRVGLAATSSNPPGDNRYHHPSGADYSLLKLKDTFQNLDWRLLIQVSETDIRVTPYNRNATAASRGWHYVISSTDLGVSETVISIFGITFYIPKPTQWVVVRGPSDELTPQSYVFDSTNADGSLRDQEQLREQIGAELPAINTIYRLYEDEIDLTPAQQAAGPYEHLTSDRMLNKINEGQHIVSLSGHGWWGGCCGYGVNTASNSTNGYHSYIAYADSCSTNKFDYDDAVSELSLFNPNGGAVAYIGNSRFSWIGVGDNFQRAFFHRLTTNRHLGLLNDTRCSMVNEATGFWKRYNKWAIFALNLMGDPEMPVWIGQPKTMFVNFKKELDKRKPLHVTVMRRGIFGFKVPLPHATVNISQGNFQRTIKTNAAGHAVFDISSTDLGDLEITVSKIGYLTHIDQAEVVGPLWVAGLVKLIEHQQPNVDSSYIQLQLDPAVEGHTRRGWHAHKSLPDYGVIMDAATDAYIAEKKIHFLVNNIRDGGGIEKFRFGTRELSLPKRPQFELPQALPEVRTVVLKQPDDSGAAVSPGQLDEKTVTRETSPTPVAVEEE